MNLNLTLLPEYYKLIKSGTKTVEYRDITEYYAKRLIVGGEMPSKGKQIRAKHYDTVTFYCKGEEPMKVEWGGLFLYPKKEPKYFAIKLGKIL